MIGALVHDRSTAQPSSRCAGPTSTKTMARSPSPRALVEGPNGPVCARPRRTAPTASSSTTPPSTCSSHTAATPRPMPAWRESRCRVTRSCSATSSTARRHGDQTGSRSSSSQPAATRVASLPAARPPSLHGDTNARRRTDRDRLPAALARSHVHDLNVYAHAVPGGDRHAAETLATILRTASATTAPSQWLNDKSTPSARLDHRVA